MTNFLQYLLDALSLGSIYALTALGIGLLFGILRLINFAHGDLITVAAYALIVPSARPRWPSRALSSRFQKAASPAVWILGR